MLVILQCRRARQTSFKPSNHKPSNSINTMKAIYVITAALCGLSLSTQLIFGQGSLTPPGAPAPTMKTLDQIEPRTPITSLIYTISQPGSYYLTTNLTGGAFNGINITANGVTLDLMGFELVGGPGNAGFGITVSGMRTNITVRNGTVRNWGGDGVHLSAARNCVLQNVRALNNSEAGLVVGDASVVNGCVASFNTSDGIVGGEACSILGCVVFTNHANGIRIGAVGVVRDCSAMRNGAAGLITEEGSTINDCSAAYNSSTGIKTSPGSTVTGCSAYANKGHGITDETGTLGVPGLSLANCAANYNDQDGFYLSNGSTVKNCLSKGNGGNGIRTNVGSTITDCSAPRSSMPRLIASAPQRRSRTNITISGHHATDVRNGRRFVSDRTAPPNPNAIAPKSADAMRSCIDRSSRNIPIVASAMCATISRLNPTRKLGRKASHVPG